MRRRTVLASITGVLGAGCTSGDPESGATATLTPTDSGSRTEMRHSRAVQSMSAAATGSTPELTVRLHDDAEVPGETESEYVPLEQLRVEDAYTGSWSESITYDGQSELTVVVDPPEWPASGAAAGINTQFDEPFRETINFEVTADATVRINDYSTAHD